MSFLFRFFKCFTEISLSKNAVQKSLNFIQVKLKECNPDFNTCYGNKNQDVTLVDKDKSSKLIYGVHDL